MENQFQKNTLHRCGQVPRTIRHPVGILAVPSQHELGCPPSASLHAWYSLCNGFKNETWTNYNLSSCSINSKRFDACLFSVIYKMHLKVSLIKYLNVTHGASFKKCNMFQNYKHSINVSDGSHCDGMRRRRRAERIPQPPAVGQRTEYTRVPFRKRSDQTPKRSLNKFLLCRSDLKRYLN